VKNSISKRVLSETDFVINYLFISFSLTESMMPGEGQVGMMQIDCEVMNTQLIHVQKTAIPRDVREKHNNTRSWYKEDFHP
jgi:hypothetical protein